MRENRMQGNEMRKNGTREDRMQGNEMRKNGTRENRMQGNEMRKNGTRENRMQGNEMRKNGMRENSILVIDDDLILLKTAEEILSEQYNVSVAKSGMQALNLLIYAIRFSCSHL